MRKHSAAFAKTLSQSSAHASQSPLHQYLKRARKRSKKEYDVGQWLFGVPRSQAFNLRQLRIVNTTDHKFQDIIKNLMGVREKNAGDVNDVITMLRDTRVNWSYFDIIESDSPNRRSHWVLCTWSIVGQLISTSLAMFAFLSVWYSSVICAFDTVLLYDNTFYPESTAYQTLAGIDIGIDILYCLGTLSQLRTTFIDPLLYVETCNPEKIRRRCLRSLAWWADLLSCTPGALLKIFPALSVRIQLLKGIRLRCLLSWIFDLNNTSLLVMRPYWQQILRLVLLIFLLGHLVGCFWHSISSPSLHPLLDESAGGQRWALPENADRALLLYYAYFCKTGLYLALGIIVQGYSVVENALIGVLAPLGAVVNALILSRIIVLVSRSTALETRSLERMEHLKQAISTQGLPASIQLRILAYHTQQRVQRSREDTREIFRGLSMQLHFELNLVLYFNLIIGADIFKKSHPRVLRQIVLVFEDKLFLPGDYVCRYADEGTEMYFIFKGLVSVISVDFVELSTMGKGRHFGEIALLTGQRRTAYVRANLFCMLASLSKKNFDSIMHEYPQQLELIMEQMSAKRRHWMQKLVAGKTRQEGGSMLPVPEANTDSQEPSDSSHRLESVEDKVADSENGNGTADVTMAQALEPGGRRDSTIQGRLGGSVLHCHKEESESDDEDDDTDEESEEEDEDKGSSAGSSEAEQDPSQLIDLISKRCSMAVDTHNQFVVQLQKISNDQRDNCKLALSMNNNFERYYVEHASQERTVMLECICSDVDMMFRGIKDATMAMDINEGTGASTMFSQAIAKGISMNSENGHTSPTGSHNLAEPSNRQRSRETEADVVDADRTVL